MTNSAMYRGTSKEHGQEIFSSANSGENDHKGHVEGLSLFFPSIFYWQINNGPI